MAETVLVTGGTGYIAGWVIAELLERGDHPKTYVARSLRSRMPPVLALHAFNGLEIH